jgi:hypothetical protein
MFWNTLAEYFQKVASSIWVLVLDILVWFYQKLAASSIWGAGVDDTAGSETYEMYRGFSKKIFNNHILGYISS